MVWYGVVVVVVWYGMVWHGMVSVWYDKVRYGVAWCDTWYGIRYGTEKRINGMVR